MTCYIAYFPWFVIHWMSYFNITYFPSCISNLYMSCYVTWNSTNDILHCIFILYICHVILHIFHIFASIYVMLCYIFSIILHAALCYLWSSFINVYYFMLHILQIHFIHLIVLCFYMCLYTAYNIMSPYIFHLTIKVIFSYKFSI
jgi:hypothetical protein